MRLVKTFIGFGIFVTVLFGGVRLLFAGNNLAKNKPSSMLEFTGAEETVYSPNEWGLNWMPDGNMSFLKLTDTVHLWFTARRETYYFQGATIDNLVPFKVTSGTAIPVLDPSGTGFDKDYAGAGSVVQATNGLDLLMFYHAENHSCDPVNLQKIKAAIGLARSTDGGKTWRREGQILSGRDVASNCPVKFNGVGYPSVVISPDGRYYYLYYMDWWNTDSALGADEIHLARALISDDGLPGSWSKYYNGAFSQPGLGGNSTPVIRRSDANAGFAGNPNISFNISLGEYIAIVTGHNGFSYALSSDGVHWSVPVLFFPFPVRTDELQTGDVWYSYASLLSPSQPAHNITDGTAYLYYSRGVFNTQPHYMVRRPLKIGFQIYLPLIVKNFSNVLTSCGEFQQNETRRIAPASFVVGDVVINNVRQYDLGGDSEGTVAFFEENATVFAEWGAACYHGNSSFFNQLSQNEFDNGCGTGCAKVRRVTIKPGGQQDVQCYYPDGSIKNLQKQGNNTWCP